MANLYLSVELLDSSSQSLLYSSLTKINDLPLSFSGSSVSTSSLTTPDLSSNNLNSLKSSQRGSSLTPSQAAVGAASSISLNVYPLQSLNEDGFIKITFDPSQSNSLRQTSDDYPFCYALPAAETLLSFEKRPSLIEPSVPVVTSTKADFYNKMRFKAKDLVNCWIEDPKTLVVTNFGRAMDEEVSQRFAVKGLFFSDAMRSIHSQKVGYRLDTAEPLRDLEHWVASAGPSSKGMNGYSGRLPETISEDSAASAAYLFNGFDSAETQMKELILAKERTVLSASQGHLPVHVSHQTSLQSTDVVYAEQVSLPIMSQSSLDSPSPLDILGIYFKSRLSLSESDTYFLLSLPTRISSGSVFNLRAASLFQEISLSRQRECSLLSFRSHDSFFTLFTKLTSFLAPEPSLVFKPAPVSGDSTYGSYQRLLQDSSAYQALRAIELMLSPSQSTLFIAQNPALKLFMAQNHISVSDLDASSHTVSPCLKNGNTLDFLFQDNLDPSIPVSSGSVSSSAQSSSSIVQNYIEKGSLVLLMIPSLPTDSSPPRVSLSVSSLTSPVPFLQSSLSFSQFPSASIPMYQNPALLSAYLDPTALDPRAFGVLSQTPPPTTPFAAQIDSLLDLETAIASIDTVFTVYRGIFNPLRIRLSAANLVSQSSISSFAGLSPSNFPRNYFPDKLDFFLVEDYNGSFSLDSALSTSAVGLSEFELALGVSRSAPASLYFLKFRSNELLKPGAFQKLPLIKLQVAKKKFDLLSHWQPTSSGSRLLSSEETKSEFVESPRVLNASQNGGLTSRFAKIPLRPDKPSLSLFFKAPLPLQDDAEFLIFLIDAGSCVTLDNNEEPMFFLNKDAPHKLIRLKVAATCDKFSPKLLLLELPPEDSQKFVVDAINRRFPNAMLTAFDELNARRFEDTGLLAAVVEVYSDPEVDQVLFLPIFLEFQLFPAIEAAAGRKLRGEGSSLFF